MRRRPRLEVKIGAQRARSEAITRFGQMKSRMTAGMTNDSAGRLTLSEYPSSRRANLCIVRSCIITVLSFTCSCTCAMTCGCGFHEKLAGRHGPQVWPSVFVHTVDLK